MFAFQLCCNTINITADFVFLYSFDVKNYCRENTVKQPKFVAFALVLLQPQKYTDYYRITAIFIFFFFIFHILNKILQFPLSVSVNSQCLVFL